MSGRALLPATWRFAAAAAAAAGVVAGVVAIAGCATTVEPRGELFAIDPATDAIVWVEDDGIHRRSAEGRSFVPDPEAWRRADTLFLVPASAPGPAGGRAILFGSGRSLPGDWWGHSSRVVRISTAVDFARAAVDPVEKVLPAARSLLTPARRRLEMRPGQASGNLYFFEPDAPDRVVEAVASSGAQACHVEDPPDGGEGGANPLGRREVVESPAGDLRVATVFQGHPRAPRLTVATYEARTWPPRLAARADFPLATFEEVTGLAASPDGRLVAVFGRPAGAHPSTPAGAVHVLDLDARRVVHTREDLLPVHAVAVAPDGAGFLVSERVEDQETRLWRGRIRRFALSGEETGAWEGDHPAGRLHWLASGEGFWWVTYGRARLVRWRRRRRCRNTKS